MDLYAKRAFLIDTENAFKISSHIATLESQGHRVVKLNIGEPDFNIPEVVKEEIKKQLDDHNTHYCDPKGLLTLREAISQQIYKTRKLSVSPEQIVVFPGAKPGIGFSEQVYCDPGDEVIYPSPSFPIFESFIRYLGAKPVPAHLSEENDFKLTAEALSALITPKTKMIFLNSPSNPTGNVANQFELETIAKVILNQCHPNVRVYSDEIYERIIFDQQSHYSIASFPGMEKRTIISSGFSKSYAWTGGRIGYAIFPSIEEANVVKNLNINYFSCISPYNQEAAKVALTHPDAERSVVNMVQTFQTRRDFVYEKLREIPNLRCIKPKGTFYIFPNIQQICENLGIMAAFQGLDPIAQSLTSPTSLFQLFALYHHHVAILDRRSFGKVGSENQHYFRIAFTANEAMLAEGISRLSHAFHDTLGFQKFMREQQSLVSSK